MKLVSSPRSPRSALPAGGLAGGGPGDIPVLHSSSEVGLEWEDVGLSERAVVNGKAFFHLCTFK